MPPNEYTSITLPSTDMSYIEAWKHQNHLKSNASAVKHMFDTMGKLLDELKATKQEVDFLRAERERTMRIIEHLSGSASLKSKDNAPASQGYPSQVKPAQVFSIADTGVFSNGEPYEAEILVERYQ